MGRNPAMHDSYKVSTSSMAFSSSASVKRCFNFLAAAVVCPFCEAKTAVRSMCTCGSRISCQYEGLDEQRLARTHNRNIILI